jgi:hypothetical protein
MTVPTTITTQSYTFTSTYTQSNNVPLSYFYYVLSDSTGELKRTDLTFSGNVTVTFDGFVSGNNYSVQSFGKTINGADVQSPIYNFTVAYAQPNINTVPTIMQDCNSGLVDITVGNIVQITGTPSGSTSFLQNYGVAGNWALDLNNSASWSANVNIPETMSTTIQVKPDGFTTGKILELINGVSYEFGYESATNRFYFIIGGIYGYSDVIALPTIDYFVVLHPTQSYVKIGSTIYSVTAS